ncbi:hypothetical protein RFI_16398 [Reticulomyxa filosa]|uniref:Uncharacterized protein n=1 Tax=Reticulomyxa filosa TaxID=46433 RepID=X6N4Y8_RETFI|nr:hypothetical protein RFI_16398 [Reticulomyxa filosa]|eukprot:ETO20819.1 hypothetical protein RFI_16398 [Reticulomyxa filosa]
MYTGRAIRVTSVKTETEKAEEAMQNTSLLAHDDNEDDEIDEDQNEDDEDAETTEANGGMIKTIGQTTAIISATSTTPKHLERASNDTVVELESHESGSNADGRGVALAKVDSSGPPFSSPPMIEVPDAEIDNMGATTNMTAYESKESNDTYPSTTKSDVVRNVTFTPRSNRVHFGPSTLNPSAKADEESKTPHVIRSNTVIGNIDPKKKRKKSKQHHRSQTQANIMRDSFDHKKQLKSKNKGDSKKSRNSWSRESDVELTRAIEDAMTDSIIEMYQSIKNRPNQSLLGSLEHKLHRLTDNHSGLPSQFKQMVGNALDSDIEEQESFKE